MFGSAELFDGQYVSFILTVVLANVSTFSESAFIAAQTSCSSDNTFILPKLLKALVNPKK